MAIYRVAYFPRTIFLLNPCKSFFGPKSRYQLSWGLKSRHPVYALIGAVSGHIPGGAISGPRIAEIVFKADIDEALPGFGGVVLFGKRLLLAPSLER